MMETGLCSQEENCQLFSSLRAKLAMAIITVVTITVTMIIAATCSASAVEHIYQDGYAMEEFDPAAYEVVYNANTTMSGYGYAYTESQELDSTSGTDMKFRSLIYTEAISNPQSITVDAEGNRAWIMSSYKTASDNSRSGHIYRVDIKKYWDQGAKGDKKNSKAVTEGPEIVTGHGQTIGYDSLNDRLWYVRETKGKTTTFVQVDPDSLEIIKEIHVNFGSRGTVPPTFCFDNKGNFWMYTRSAGTSYAPAGTIRIYKGTIENDYVHIVQINQGLRYPAGSTCQSIAYNPANDRLYIVSDGEFLTVPASKLGGITADDVGVIKFTGAVKREFEGLSFSETGCAFFMTNKPAEIMRDEVSYKAAVKERERIARIKKQHKDDKADIASTKSNEEDNLILEQIGDELESGF